MNLPESAVDLLARLQTVLEDAGFPSMVVGGAATFAWGDPRTTRDLDLAVLASDDRADTVQAALEDEGFEVDGPFSTRWGLRFIVPSRTGFPADVFLDDRKELFERRRPVDIDGERLHVKASEDVVIEKLDAAADLPEERARDLEDAVGILYKQAGRLDEGYLWTRAAEVGVETLLDRALQRARSVDEGGDAGP